MQFTICCKGKKLISISHHNNITKKFNSHNGVIDDRRENCSIKNFIDRTYNVYLERKRLYQLDVTINAYLDAKAQGDYMEMRGAKLSIAMENLKSVYLDAYYSIGPDVNSGLITEYIINEDVFNNYRKPLERLLKTFLEKEGVVKNQKGRIYKNLSCINRS